MTPTPTTATYNGQRYNLIAFYYPGRDTAWDKVYRSPFCGNFWQHPLTLTIDGVSGTFQTSEAAFQATKWWSDDTIRKGFEATRTGGEAFHYKKNLTVGADYGYAGLGRDGAMAAVLEAKFTDPALAKLLLATGDAYLLEHNKRSGLDDYWSDDANGFGENMLGQSLMARREALGGKGAPCHPPRPDKRNRTNPNPFTPQVMVHRAAVMAEPVAAVPKAGGAAGGVTVVPSVFHAIDEVGDFGWMIGQLEYADAFFVFNDNKQEFLIHHKDPTDQSGCGIGGGNAVIRPYQCHTPPKAGGLPTGPGFSGLTPEVKMMIDDGVATIRKQVADHGYRRIFYSSDGHGGLGTSIFHVPGDIKNYIVQQIEGLAS